MVKNDREIKTLFSETYILGGSPCSGKSSVAERLSDRFGFRYYKVDDHEREHMRRVQPDRHPVMFKYSKMSWNEIWSRPVDEQVREEFEFYRERFEMIVEDLRRFEPGEAAILEGAAYLPELIKKCEVDPKRALFLVPTRAFQLHHYAKRPWIQGILRACDDPEGAFENWMGRDHLFGQEILRQAETYGYGTMLVDGKRDIEAQTELVIKHFGLL
jgi:hypothetical protein